jgi:hypothetical protein
VEAADFSRDATRSAARPRDERNGPPFFYESGNDPAAMLAAGRGLMAVLGAALVVLVWWWARRLGGPRIGLAAAGLAAFCPTLLAHGGLVMSDLTLSFFLLLTLTLFWSLLRRVSAVRLVATGLCAGILLLCKMSGVLVLPMMAGLALLRLVDGRSVDLSLGASTVPVVGARKLAVIVASSLVVALLAGTVLWAAFGFRFSMFANPAAPRPVGGVGWETLLGGGGIVPTVVSLLKNTRLLPEAWLHGLAQKVHTLPGRQAFLNGETRVGGWFGFSPTPALSKRRFRFSDSWPWVSPAGGRRAGPGFTAPRRWSCSSSSIGFSRSPPPSTSATDTSCRFTRRCWSSPAPPPAS